MAYIVYIDESGDHSLKKLDNSFPVFTLALFICDQEEYVHKIIPAVINLKFEFWGHEGVILHSRDIRKSQNDFGILTDTEKKNLFITKINKIMQDRDYQLITAVIKKDKLNARYIYADNPYDLSLKFALERLIHLLEHNLYKEVFILCEKRGKKEDDELRLIFYETISQGTEYIEKDRFKAFNFKLFFLDKKLNIIGTQLADLVAYPIARYVCNPKKENPAFNLIKTKFYRGTSFGLKIFP